MPPLWPIHSNATRGKRFSLRNLHALCCFAACVVAGSCAATTTYGQTFPYSSSGGVAVSGLAFADSDPAPRMMEPAEEIGHPLPRRHYIDPRYRGRGAEMTNLASRRWASRAPQSRLLSRPSRAESIGPGASGDPFVEVLPGDEVTVGRPGDTGPMFDGPIADEAYPGGPPTSAPMIDGYGPDGIPADGYDGSGYYDDYAGSCGGCGHCDQCRSRSRLFPLLRDCWSHPGTSGSWGRNISGIGAVQAFKSPVDLGVNGNFGVYYGGNWGFPVFNRAAIGGQIGAIGSWADFQGSNGLVNSSRNQWFVTAGLFRRATCNQGLQGGAALDYLSDNFYVNMNLFQVRAEIGYVWNRHEVGFWTAAHTNSDTQAVPVAFGVPTVTWQANNQYDVYYRYYYNYNTVGRMWVGLTAFGDVLFGGDATATLNDQWAIQVAYNYMIPSNDPTIPKAIKETWGLTIGTVWYPRCKTPNCVYDSYRPLFSVADNTRFFVKAK